MQRVDASGNSVWIATSVTGNGPGVNRAHGLVLDGSSIYVAGFDGVNGNVGWRIEKRDKSNGTLVNGFGSNGVVTRQLSAWNDTATGIASDPTGLLVSGWKGGASGNNGWWIEKIDPTTGNTLTCFGTAGVVTHDPTTSSDEAYGVVADGTGAYVYGRDMTPGNGAWRVYKLNTIGLQGFNVVAGGNVGIGTRTPHRILTIQQNSATDPVADAWTIYSSRRWKSEITPLAGALDKVLQLHGVRYRWNTTGQRDIGLIAEDVGAVVPEACRSRRTARTPLAWTTRD